MKLLLIDEIEWRLNRKNRWRDMRLGLFLERFDDIFDGDDVIADVLLHELVEGQIDQPIELYGVHSDDFHNMFIEVTFTFTRSAV